MADPRIKMLLALRAARGVLLTLSERDGDIDYWNDDGEGYRAYVLVAEAIEKSENKRAYSARPRHGS